MTRGDTMSIPIEAIRDGYLALGLPGPVYLGERPARETGACVVLTPVGGVADPDLPLTQWAVRVEQCHPDQQTAHQRAWAAYQALHRRAHWMLTDWLVLWCEAAAPPSGAPAENGQGVLLYRAAFGISLTMKARTQS